jgi:hypothetical protein
MLLLFRVLLLCWVLFICSAVPQVHAAAVLGAAQLLTGCLGRLLLLCCLAAAEVRRMGCCCCAGCCG